MDAATGLRVGGLVGGLLGALVVAATGLSNFWIIVVGGVTGGFLGWRWIRRS